MDVCLFCGGDPSAPGHRERCDGRQGRIEAEEPVLNPAKAREVTERGIQQSTDHAPAYIAELARLKIEALARVKDTITSDDVWEQMPPALMRAWNPSALGVVFRSLRRDGVLQLTSERRESQRPAHHRKPLRVWRSLIRVTG
jgi:hypothetical protein